MPLARFLEFETKSAGSKSKSQRELYQMGKLLHSKGNNRMKMQSIQSRK
jgi:hypothetical protein